MLTRDEIMSMQAGRELDALVAEHVMGWTRHDYIKSNDAPVTYYMIDTDKDNGGGVFVCKPSYTNPKMPDVWFYMWHKFNPSANVADAWQVVEKFDAYSIEGRPATDSPERYHYVTLYNGATGDAGSINLPLAICRAALMTTIR